GRGGGVNQRDFFGDNDGFAYATSGQRQVNCAVCGHFNFNVLTLHALESLSHATHVINTRKQVWHNIVSRRIGSCSASRGSLYICDGHGCACQTRTGLILHASENAASRGLGNDWNGNSEK